LLNTGSQAILLDKDKYPVALSITPGKKVLLKSDVPLEGRCALNLTRSKIQWFSDVFAAFFY